MSFAAEMLAASTEAQSVLAQIGGAAAGATNALYNGAEYLAVYGQPVVMREMLASGGYRQRSLVQTTATKAQFDVPPVANLNWVRTDTTPQITYRIQKVDLHDPFVFGLTLVRVGEV
jgi:hypothetical protein